MTRYSLRFLFFVVTIVICVFAAKSHRDKMWQQEKLRFLEIARRINPAFIGHSRETILQQISTELPPFQSTVPGAQSAQTRVIVNRQIWIDVWQSWSGYDLVVVYKLVNGEIVCDDITLLQRKSPLAEF